MSQFDEFADTYDGVVNQSVSFGGSDVDYYAKRKAAHLLALLRRHLGDPATLKALDVGCGTGITDSHLVGELGELHGVDIAAEAVNRASEVNPTVDYQTYDGARLPFEDASLDVAFAICVAHHVPIADRPSFAKEITQVVRPGGLVAIFEHNPLNPLTRLAVSRCEFDEGVVLLSRPTVANLLEQAGLEVIERRYIIFTPFDRPVLQRIEDHLHALPLGAQHCVVGRRH